MRGVQSMCCICGAAGRVFGCPGWFDVCRDTDACRMRAVAKERLESERLRERVKALEGQLAKK
jgi:hypothetical protein